MENSPRVPSFRWSFAFGCPKGAAFSAPVAEKAYTVMCGETGILFSFSQLTPLTQSSPRLRGEREKTGMGPQTQGSASAALHAGLPISRPYRGLEQNTQPF